MTTGASQRCRAVEESNSSSDGGANIVNPLATENWNSTLRAFQDPTVFHTREWAKTLAHTYSYKPFYVCRNGSAAAPLLLPVMEATSWLTGDRGISLPFTDECPVLHALEDGPTDLVSEVHRIPAASHWRSWEYRGGVNFHPAASAAHSYWGHQLQLSQKAEVLFAHFDGSVRTALRKASQHEVVTHTAAGSDAMRTFYRQLCETRRRHGLPPQPYRFFAEIERTVLANGLGFIVIASNQGVPVASAVFLHFGENAVYKFAASDFRFRSLQANHAVLWHGIQECARRGCRKLDFGRTSRSNTGLRHFKLAWRPDERTINYVKYDLRRERYVEAESDLSTGWHNRLFRLLPLPISKAIGAIAYRHFA